jgi:IS1 family transposase
LLPKVLKRETQESILKCLSDGVSIRATERILDVHRDTILRFMLKVGEGCDRLMDQQMRGLECRYIEVDEIWGFIGKKQRHLTAEDDITELGDTWTFVALDKESKVIPSYIVGKRTSETAHEFMTDLSSRLINRVQLSADALHAYVDATWWAFKGDVDFGQVVKSYEAEPIGPGRYSPPHVVSATKTPVHGRPDKAHISTSHIERSNLSMRMNMRRLTRLTNGFSKKLENHRLATALWFGVYNYVRVHGSIRVTPAMAAGVTPRLWSMGDLLDAAMAQY